ncbi:hypothetical protein AVEN_150866-1 [Araneus ventricosus]|uniref:RNase H type-1 domain-containing protein n=1 Tax=Araneus ventricosus TaxID=182803 RepID=A0A4Y2KG73_ARAVE|nr:hypothetical protein AVEN_150866-1 [Araneus ventricosus]
MLALKAAIEWAITTNEEVNNWSDSESRIQALKSLYVKSKIIQQAQINLLQNARTRLVWIKADIGIKFYETEDTIAKDATTDGTPANLPFPNSYLQNQLLQLYLSRWKAEWDNEKQKATLIQRMHPIRHWPWALPQLPKDIRSPFNILLRMWGNRKSSTLRNEMPTNFIISPKGTKPAIHCRLVEERPIQQTFKTNYRSSH